MKIERVQTGVRLEKRILKVLKGLAEHQDRSLGEIIEIIAIHSFENMAPFSRETLTAVKDLKKVYGLNFNVHDYEKFIEQALS